MATAPDRSFAEAERRRDSDHESFLVYRGMRWFKIALALSLIALLGYALADVKPRPNGGSWYGYTLGTIGALLIVWLSLLGVRKRAMTSGAWSLKAWTSAHVYLGLSLIVIATLHTGFQFGWNVHTLAYALMLLVIASGVYGIVVYAMLPTALSNNRREMTQREMVESLAATDRQLEQAAQPLGRDDTDRVIAALERDPFGYGLLTRLSGRYRDDPTEIAIEALSGAQRDQADERVRALLNKRLAQLQQIRRHMRLKAMLEVWLYVHVPATVALLGALTAHIVSVFYYW
jgi:predicted negative regulator of RcsB-dependent stress response